jgi:GNAT superfamily N-acetyltransferase
MNAVMRVIEEKITNRYRQFGGRAATRQLVGILLRPVCRRDAFTVFYIPDFAGIPCDDPDILPLDAERVGRAAERGELTVQETALLTECIATGCKGFCVERDGKLAGYAWVQFSGAYAYGGTGTLEIPQNAGVIKDVFVCSEYRGQGIGRKLTAACLGAIPAGHLPLVMSIPENRYAIRNWRRYGFVAGWSIRRTKWMGGAVRCRYIADQENLTAMRLQIS